MDAAQFDPMLPRCHTEELALVSLDFWCAVDEMLESQVTLLPQSVCNPGSDGGRLKRILRAKDNQARWRMNGSDPIPGSLHNTCGAPVCKWRPNPLWDGRRDGRQRPRRN